MKSPSRRIALALLCAGAACGAQAAQVTLTNWAFGNGNKVNSAYPTSQTYKGQAGGFVGTLAGTSGLDSSPFITYCVELEEQFGFGTTAMSGYSVVAGSSYFGNARASTIGRLMTFAYANPMRVDNDDESTSLQLALWNLVYDSDFTVTSGGYADSSSFASYANVLLSGAAGTLASAYNVYALQKTGSQDFLLLGPLGSNRVPEPASLVLAALGLTALGALRRRRAHALPAAAGVVA